MERCGHPHYSWLPLQLLTGCGFDLIIITGLIVIIVARTLMYIIQILVNTSEQQNKTVTFVNWLTDFLKLYCSFAIICLHLIPLLFGSHQ